MKKQLAERQLTLPAVTVLRWEELPEDTRLRMREPLAALLRDAAVRAKRSADGQEGGNDEH